ncbi:DUF402 domain-containing protein [Kribbella antibiotica]|uniref:DUF402 domain-containing protein n=2 Tax=Kribbella antibiotica TaxID=190195 RepID=A0A4R4YZ56_9ACTN|nr:DUF402 domain-containing protein [Kribbella antibiotica]
MTVVRDDADGLVAWLAPGTPILKTVLTDGRELRHAGPVGMFTEPRALKLDTWRGTGILKVLPTGKPWSVWHFWGSDGRFHGWYVNLELLHTRDFAGRRTSTRDNVLDLWITHDRVVQWKDEDELEGAVVAGRFTQAEADRITATAHDAVQDIESWTAPFSDGWRTWSAPADWPLPAAPTSPVPTLIADHLVS